MTKFSMLIKWEAVVACCVPVILLLTVVGGGFAAELSRPTPKELSFAVPVADFLRESGVWVWRISEASHYETPSVRAASVETSAGSVQVLEFADPASARGAARNWFPSPPRVTADSRTLYFTTSPRLDALAMRFVARDRAR